MFEVLAHYANTGKETLSPIVDSSIDNFLLQTNPVFATAKPSKFWRCRKIINKNVSCQIFWWKRANFGTVKKC